MTSPDSGGMVYVSRSAQLPRPEYRFYRAILLEFPKRGGPPDRAALRQLAQRFGVGLEPALALLGARDLVQCDPTTGGIAAAYPFSGVPTAHHVHLAATSDQPSVDLFAMCALDALGIPLMLRRAASITSVDGLDGEPVRVSVEPVVSGTSAAHGAESGQWSATWDPEEAVVVGRPEDHHHEHGVGAADTCCPIINFFRSADHAEQWALAAQTDCEVRVYSQTEALRYAAILFAGVLDQLPHGSSSRVEHKV